MDDDVTPVCLSTVCVLIELRPLFSFFLTAKYKISVTVGI